MKSEDLLDDLTDQRAHHGLSLSTPLLKHLSLPAPSPSRTPVAGGHAQQAGGHLQVHVQHGLRYAPSSSPSTWTVMTAPVPLQEPPCLESCVEAAAQGVIRCIPSPLLTFPPSTVPSSVSCREPARAWVRDREAVRRVDRRHRPRVQGRQRALERYWLSTCVCI